MDASGDKRVYIDSMKPPESTHEALIRAMRTHRAFSLLSETERAELSDEFARVNWQVGHGLAEPDALPFCWLLQGRVQWTLSDSDRCLTLEPGDCFGLGTPVFNEHAIGSAVQACEVASLDAATWHHWVKRVPVLSWAAGIVPQTDGHGASPGLMTRSVRSLLRRAPVVLTPAASIREAAELMRVERVSSVLLMADGAPWGLLTDRDLRNRVIAAGVDPASPVGDVATRYPLTLAADAPALDALLLMARHNIHHVPVMDGAEPLGMITTSNLIEHHSTSVVYLIGEVHKQDDLAGLQAAAARVAKLQHSLTAAGATAYSCAHLITAVTDAITVRLLQLGERRLGPPPVPYVWAAAGSQARHEQTALTDQDNCLILDDAYDEARDGAYFKALAEWTCDGLHACGYVHCPGDIMARNPRWRKPRAHWAEYFHHWVDSPAPEALMLTCVFFDQRAVHGSFELLRGLRREVLALTRTNRIFLAHMVSNALGHTPPLGLFGQLTPARSGTYRGTLDLKHQGIVPVVDLARVFALAAGHEAVNTQDRLNAVAGDGEISTEGARDLLGAMEFLSALRLRHQARQLAAGEKADNHLVVATLSNLERNQLRDAFSVVHQIQSVMAQRYTAGRF